MAAHHVVLIEELRPVNGRSKFVPDKDVGRTNWPPALACQAPAELGILSVHEKCLVKKAVVPDHVLGDQEAAAGQIMEGERGRS